MPRKKKKETKSKPKKKTKEQDSDKEKVEKSEESDLEEQVEGAEEVIETDQFQDFIQPSVSVESFSPVLERVEVPQESLEQDVASAPSPSREQEEPVRYETRYDESDYESIREELRRGNEDLLAIQPEPVKIETAGRDLHPQLRDVGFVNPELHELRRDHEDFEEKYVQLEKINKENQRFSLPGQQERKYKGKLI